MAQNNNTSLTLGNRVSLLNKMPNIDLRYGPYDDRSLALSAMQSYGQDGRQVVVYTDKPNGKVELLLYNEALNVLRPINGFETQEITSGGNYNDLEVTGDLLVFSNTNAQAILNGIWGKKEFHILNLSDQYEVQINDNSSSVSGNGQPIRTPISSLGVGVKGTARILSAESYGYFVSDVWASLSRPEFYDVNNPITENRVMVIKPDYTADSEATFDYELFRDAQNVPMTSAELDIAYPTAERSTQIICEQINTVYKKVKSSPSEWRSFVYNDVTKETIVTTGGAINNQPTPTNFLNFTNQITPVILAGFNDSIDGKELTIWNNTLQAIDLLNESLSAVAENRMINLGLQDLLLPVDGKVVYRYSSSLSRWTMVGIFGAGYEPTLKGVGTRAMTVLPSGVVASEEVAEFRVWNEAITTDQSNSQLNILYPNAFQGFTVVCKNNGREYEMDNENAKTWIWAPLNIV